MLTTFVAAILLFGALFVAMAVGVLMGRKPIKGSCGGVGATGIDANCSVCGGQPSRCEADDGVGRADRGPGR